MIKVVFSNDFLKFAKRLPIEIQNKLATNIELAQNSPFHPLLHSKPLTGRLTGFYSFRVTRDWRVIFCFVNTETIKLVKIANRKDIYR
jgi:addiction module RelE/StbE family toxin